ncbi:MAG: hypothetical protein ACTSU5_12090 [Promethearchaeota archaeon]
MAQINVRISEEQDEIIEFLAKKKKISKAQVARELIEEGLTSKLLPLLLSDYARGKVGLKKIINLTNLSPGEVMDEIVKAGIEPPIPGDVDDYTRSVTDRLLERLTRS